MPLRVNVELELLRVPEYTDDGPVDKVVVNGRTKYTQRSNGFRNCACCFSRMKRLLCKRTLDSSHCPHQFTFWQEDVSSPVVDPVVVVTEPILRRVIVTCAGPLTVTEMLPVWLLPKVVMIRM